MQSRNVTADLTSMFEGDDQDINLARAALLFSTIEHPDLDIDAELSALDSMGKIVLKKLEAHREPMSDMNVLSEYLFDELGFHGDQTDYYNPENSFLNIVLSTRRGIPISLALLYIEVGSRVGIPLLGIGMPGHFLVKHEYEDDVFVDPFYGGILLSKQECIARFNDMSGKNAVWQDTYLLPVTKTQFLTRIVRNLKFSYLRSQDHFNALKVIDWTLALKPRSSQDLRDRGLVKLRIGQAAEALDDLRHYVEMSPTSPDAPAVRRLLGRLKRRLGKE